VEEAGKYPKLVSFVPDRDAELVGGEWGDEGCWKCVGVEIEREG
jgi:hypothetical protein